MILQPLDIGKRGKRVPREWINAEGNNVTPEFMDYALPLVRENQRVLEQGLPFAQQENPGTP